MKYVSFLLCIILFSCQQRSNNLSQKQLEDGWELLFDGKTLDGWRTFKNQPNNSWKVVDGTLHSLPFDSANQRADLVTIKQYKNFELQFDWKIGYQGNSGVMFRVTEDLDLPYLTGPEYQILDDVGYPGESPEENLTGANFAMHVAQNKTMNPQGEWNSSKLLVNGNHVEHWLNGIMVLTYELGSEEWKQLKANCKWKDVEAYGINNEGHINLQDHGSEVWFKNIAIRIL